MSCPNFAPLLSRLLDRELSASETAFVERHIATCSACRATLEAWRGDGLALRGFFKAHALNEDFVGRVRQSTQADRFATRSSSWSWLRYAAAALVAVVLIARMFQNGDSLTLARVVSPGERLEVRPDASLRWMPAEAGTRLHNRDWLRKPSSGAAELLLKDSSRLSLESGAVAQLRLTNSRPEIALVQGSMQSEVRSGSAGLQVSTLAGTIAAASNGAGSSDTKFGVRVRSIPLANLKVGPDGSEIASGSVRLVGAVNVESGAVSLARGATRREIAAGNGAAFTSADVPVATRADAAAVEARLETVEAGAAQSSLQSSLSSSSGGYQVTVTVESFPVARLLEWVTDASVRADATTHVTGTVTYPVDATAEEVAGSIGRSLGVEVDLRRERVVSSTAVIGDTVSGSAAAAPEFTVRLGQDGRISFQFRSVAAGEVFRALRRQNLDVPYLAAESEWVPVNLEVQNLEPARVRDWLEKNLELSTRAEERTIVVAQVRSMGSGVSAAASRKGASPSGDASGGSSSAPAAPAAAGSREPSRQGDVSTGGRLSVLTPAWNMLKTAVTGAGPFRPTSGGLATLQSRLTAGDEGSVLKSLRRSRRLIWPVLSSTDDPAGVSYYLYNGGAETAEIHWSGYDEGGRLVALMSMDLASGAAVVMRPDIDFGVRLAAGGYWESSSTIPVAAALGNGGAAPYAAPFDPDRLPGIWEIALKGLESGEESPWIVNPAPESARALLAVMNASGQVVVSREIVLQPHGSWVWEDASAHARGGTLLLVQVTHGAVIAGIGERGAALPRVYGEEDITISPTKR
jgi:hypothetical protein